MKKFVAETESYNTILVEHDTFRGNAQIIRFLDNILNSIEDDMIVLYSSENEDGYNFKLTFDRMNRAFSNESFSNFKFEIVKLEGDNEEIIETILDDNFKARMRYLILCNRRIINKGFINVDYL